MALTVTAFLLGCWVGALVVGMLARGRREETPGPPPEPGPGRHLLPNVQPRSIAPYKLERDPGALAIDPVIFDRSRFEPVMRRRINTYGRLVQYEQWRTSPHNNHEGGDNTAC